MLKELLKELTALDGVGGFEDDVRAYIEDKVRDAADSMNTDPMGNLYVFKKGAKRRAKTLMVCAHMDEVGFLVHRITEDGMLKIVTVGGIDPRVLVGRRMKVGAKKIKGIISIKAIHLTTPESRKVAPGLDTLYIDIGANSRADAEKYVSRGEPVYFDSDFTEFGDRRIKAKAIDDRIGCACMIELINDGVEYDTWFAFTVQEECGLRGARVAGNRIAPDYVMALEGTTAADLPSVEEHLHATTQGEGVVVSVMDGGTVYNRELREHMLSIATTQGIKWQYRKTGTGGTDIGAVHLAKAGCKAFGLATPTRYIHSATNVLFYPDAEEMLKMAKLFIKESGVL